jgi:hypothetical protein
MAHSHRRKWRVHARERFAERINIGISYNKFEWKWFHKGKYSVIKRDQETMICLSLIDNVRVWFIVKVEGKKRRIVTFLTEQMAALATGQKTEQ